MEAVSRTGEVPHLDIVVHEDTIDSGVKVLAGHLRPDWNLDEVQFEDNSGGYCNKNYHAYVPNKPGDLFIRLVNAKIDNLQEDLVKSMTYLGRQGLGAKLLCTFTNGLVMEYVPGETVTWSQYKKVKDARVWKAAAREMARYHAATNMADIHEIGIETYDAMLQRSMARLKTELDKGSIPEAELVGLPSADIIHKILIEIQTKLASLGAEVCFSHLDSNPTNVIITDNKEVVFVDYDTCCLQFGVTEIAHWFFTAMDITNINIDEQPTDKEKHDFIVEYLNTRRDLDPSRGPVTDDQIHFTKYLVRIAFLTALVNALSAFMQMQTLTPKKIGMKTCHVFWEWYEKEKTVMTEKFQ